MLGRLKLDVDVCILTYESLVESGYQKKSTKASTSIDRQNAEEPIRPALLRTAIQNAMSVHGAFAIEAFNDGEVRSCRT
jgi:hypothetical protein